MSNNGERERIAEQFLAELGRGIPDDERLIVGYAPEATVQTGPDGRKLNAGWWPQPHRAGKPIQTSNNCYVTISSSIKTRNSKGQMRYWRGEASFGHGLALMVDDIGDGSGSKGSLSVQDLSQILPPTVVVQTSPGNHQLWYFFNKPEPNMRRFKNFLVAFVNQVLSDRGGDSTIRDVSRYGRMPIGINNKRADDGSLKYGGRYGYEVSLVSADYSRRYSMDQIASAFQFVISEPVPPRPPSAEEISERWLDKRLLDVSVIVLSRAKYGEGSNGKVTMNMSGKYRIRCPWGDEHTNRDPFGAYFRGPIPGAEHEYVFGCAHDTCRKDNKRGWTAFIDKIALPAIYESLERANAKDWPLEVIAAHAATECVKADARAAYLNGLKARVARSEVAA